MANSKGRESSILLLLSISCVVIGILISHQMTEDSQLGMPTTVVVVTLVVLQLPAIITMMIVYCKKNDPNFVTYDSHRTSDGATGESMANRVKHNFTIIGLYVFGTGSVILDILTVVSELECSKYVGISPQEKYLPLFPLTQRPMFLYADVFAMTLAFHVLKVLFFIAQMTFLMQFSSAKFVRVGRMRIVIASIACVNVATWFYCFLHEVDETREKFQDDHNRVTLDFSASSINDSDPIVSDLFIKCIHGNTSLAATVDSAARYLYPFAMEFSLIAIGILHHIWVATGGSENAKTVCVSQSTNTVSSRLTACDKQTQTEAMAADIGESGETHTSEDETTGEEVGASREVGISVVHFYVQPDIVPAGTVQIRPNAAEGDDEKQPLLPRLPSEIHRNKIGIAFHFGYVFIVIHLVVETLMYDEDIFKIILPIHYGLQMTFYILTIGVCIWMLKILKRLNLPPERQAYSEEDVLLLLASVGTLMLYTLSLTAALSMVLKGYTPPTTLGAMPYLVAVDSVANIIQIVLQNLVLVKAARTDMRSGTPAEVRFLANAVAFLGVSNLALWILDSFVELQLIDAFPVQRGYFEDNWLYIVLSTYPLAIFYRFHSMDIIVKVMP